MNAAARSLRMAPAAVYAANELHWTGSRRGHP